MAYARAVWAAGVARLIVSGAITLAVIVDALTRSQLRRQLGALPVLYALLEVLHVREIVNRYCPTEAQVDHGDGLNRALGPDDPRIILCHRGTLDPLAYWLDRGWPEDEFFAFTIIIALTTMGGIGQPSPGRRGRFWLAGCNGEVPQHCIWDVF